MALSISIYFQNFPKRVLTLLMLNFYQNVKIFEENGARSSSNSMIIKVQLVIPTSNVKLDVNLNLLRMLRKDTTKDICSFLRTIFPLFMS